MNYSASTLVYYRFVLGIRVLMVMLAFVGGVLAIQVQTVPIADGSTDLKQPLVIDGSSGGDVFGLSQSVIVRGQVAKGVIAFGGDVIVEGRVNGDVASIGGSVIQREGSYIGGDVIVLGGAYHHGKDAPGRDPSSSTIMVAGYEQELRTLMRDPTSVLAPKLSPGYFGLRGLAILFWFVVSWGVAAITPGAISRAIVRLRLTNIRIFLIGCLGAVVASLGVGGGLRVLPNTIGAMVLVVAILLGLLAYLFGRVVINAATGQWLQRILLPERWRSDTWALLLGAAFWTLVLSLPYVWPVMIVLLLIVGFGICLTGRYRLGWRSAAKMAQ
jgi:hypothetical protein